MTVKYLRETGFNVMYMEVLQTQTDYEPVHEDELDSESFLDEASHSGLHIEMVDEPEPSPSGDDHADLHGT